MLSCNGQEHPTEYLGDLPHATVDAPEQQRMVRTQAVASGNVDRMLQDRNGAIWFGTGGEGAYRFDGATMTNFTQKDGLPDNTITAIVEDGRGGLLFGTSKGICRYDGKQFTPFTTHDDASKRSITSLLVDTHGNVWFGTWANGIHRYDGKVFSNFLNNDDHPFNLGVHNQLIVDMLQDKDGNIWFSSWNGGGVWRYDGSTFENFLPAPEYYTTRSDERSGAPPDLLKPIKGSAVSAYPRTSEHITDDMIFSIAADKAGDLWFGTRRHGACKFDGSTFTSYREHEGFVSYGISAIVQDDKGIMWLGTDKNGFYSFDGSTFKNFTETDGLVNNSVRSILADTSGNIWLGTRGFGTSRYDGRAFTTFSEGVK